MYLLVMVMASFLLSSNNVGSYPPLHLKSFYYGLPCMHGVMLVVAVAFLTTENIPGSENLLLKVLHCNGCKINFNSPVLLLPVFFSYAGFLMPTWVTHIHYGSSFTTS